MLTEEKYHQLATVAERKAKTLLRHNRIRIPKGESHFVYWRNWIESSAYQYYLNTPCRKKNDLLKIAGLAYSWMPTMLDFYFPEDYDFPYLLDLIKRLKRGNADDFVKFALVVELAKHVNHSVVGASKTLHIISPENAPFTDSRVIKGWNSFFKTEILRNRKLRLPSTWNYNSDSDLFVKAEAYLRYWNALLEWQANLEDVSVRDLEVLFYFIGGNNRIN